MRMGSRKPRPSLTDEQTFVLPIHGLFADLEGGQGCVRLPDEFAAASTAVQVEVIQQWREDLDELTRQLLQQLFRDVVRFMPDMSHKEQVLRFRATCESLGIRCPTALDDMLGPP